MKTPFTDILYNLSDEEKYIKPTITKSDVICPLFTLKRKQYKTNIAYDFNLLLESLSNHPESLKNLSKQKDWHIYQISLDHLLEKKFNTPFYIVFFGLRFSGNRATIKLSNLMPTPHVDFKEFLAIPEFGIKRKKYNQILNWIESLVKNQ